MGFWDNKKVVVTGGHGFLGSFLVQKLRDRGCQNIFVPDIKDYDLVNLDAVKRLYRDAKPDIVIHLAAKVGGIGANRENPGEFFYDNLMMGAQLMEAAASRGREVRGPGDDLLLPEVHPGAVPGGRPLERLSRGDQRPLRPGQEDAAGPVPGLPPAVRLQLDLPAAGQPLRPGRQFRPRLVPRHPGPDQEDASTPRRRAKEIVVWGTGTPRGSSSTWRTPPRRSCWRPSATTSPSRSTSGPASRSPSRTWST